MLCSILITIWYLTLINEKWDIITKDSIQHSRQIQLSQINNTSNTDNNIDNINNDKLPKIVISSPNGLHNQVNSISNNLIIDGNSVNNAVKENEIKKTQSLSFHD